MTVDPANSREQRLFEAALRLEPGAERKAFLQAVCAHDNELRGRLEQLLAAASEADAFFEKDPLERAGFFEKPSLPAAEAPPVTQTAGRRIGRYKLLEQIGEGGLGVVFMAEQEEPVRRRVALKIIKPGMDTQSVIARFEAERQALALMDHPNVAKILDGGVTEDGRPYFVMDLIQGLPVTQFCDEANLTAAQRLALFVEICGAVQHAHQKGIIHRDLKPSNILVTLHGDKPVPKIIDFGIAKATQQRLTDKTLFTQFQQFIGTPAYMSPEQASLSGLDIDTRSDIYSLGVLLYELLTGKTPFDAKELLQAGLDEMRRTIREKEPERPSTRVSALTREELTTTAKRRGLDPPRLVKLLRGDLDWVVLKALEKDRARRYDTVNGLARDIERYLSNEPVAARPPSRLYRFQKTVRRNRLAFATGAVILALLVASVTVSSWEAIKARRAESREVGLRHQAEVNEKAAKTEDARNVQLVNFFEEMLAGVGPEVAKGRDITILKEILDKTVNRIGIELTNQPEVEADLREAVGHVYRDLGDYQGAEANQRRFVDVAKQLDPGGSRRVAKAHDDLAMVLMLNGRYPEAEAAEREAVELGKKFLKPGDTDMAAFLSNLALILKRMGQNEQAESIYREALAMNRKFFGSEHREIAACLHNLAAVLARQDKLAEAETTEREALAMLRKVLGPDHPLVAKGLGSLAIILKNQNKLSEAESAGREAVALQRKLSPGPANPDVANVVGNLAGILEQEGRLEEAEPMQREALEARRNSLGNQHPLVAFSLCNLGLLLSKRGQFGEAEASLRESLAIAEKLPPNEFVSPANVRSNLATVLAAQGK
jgi:serine/threonine protein kinase/Tfp pilus assembly protein PilF